MSRTAIFRADARPEIGSGHVIRSLTLAEEWVDRGGDAIMCGAVPVGLHSRISRAGVELVPVERLRPTIEDASETVELALSRKAEWVVVDGYAFDIAYVEALRGANLKVLQFADGVLPGPFAADILLDQNLGSETRSYALTTPSAQALLGIQYACLGRQFRSLIAEKNIAERAKKVLVTFGGSDAGNVTGLVVEALLGIDWLESVVVVIGVSNTHSAEIGVQCQADARFNSVNNVNNMAELMADADIAVAAAGSTSWELAAMGVPSVLITIADNQEPIAEAMAEYGVAESIGRVDGGDVLSIRAAVSTLAANQHRRTGMSQAGQALVDGQGVGRVVNAMLAHGSS